jgi:hypothetical protein
LMNGSDGKRMFIIIIINVPVYQSTSVRARKNSHPFCSVRLLDVEGFL